MFGILSRCRRVYFAGGLILSPFYGCGVEQRLVFRPSAEIVRTPGDVGLPFEELFFTTSDGVRLNGWLIPHPQASATLVWFHGNAGNISHRVDNIKRLHDRIPVDILIFDYRGYGRSTGSPSEAGTYIDGQAAVEFATTRLRVEAKNLILFGRSLGSAVAAEMANRFDSRALILESPFVSIREMAKTILPFLPIGPLLQYRYDVIEKIQQLKVPLLVLHGDRDETVPYQQGKRVFDAAPGAKSFYAIAGAGHNDTYLVGGDGYYRRLRSFIESPGSTQQ